MDLLPIKIMAAAAPDKRASQPMRVAMTLRRVCIQVDRRARQLRHILLRDGYSVFTTRVRSKLSDWIKPKGFTWHVFPEDVLRADFARPAMPKVPALVDGAPIAINWIVGPAGPGSGGHTTIFRMIKYLQQIGYDNRVYFYDPYGGDHQYYKKVARLHYGITCKIGKLGPEIEDAHAVVATHWPSAYAVFNMRSAGKRFYFVQDYEPSFYPIGTNSVLAENTYRMGFHGITAGRWLTEKLGSEFGMTSDWFPFGCDTSRYRFDGSAKRKGVAFYARAGTPRRAVELGLLALELFAKRCPHIELHLFGEELGALPFKFTNHGLVSPEKLADIYNQCFAGLTLSLTNVSLVPHEMLACGCIPVVNDADHNRMVLDNSHVRYAPLLPHALADALEAVVSMSDFETESRQAAESVASISWDVAGAAIDTALRRALKT
jgi:glycosyltransferase involved in cell wall biosynthesis